MRPRRSVTTAKNHNSGYLSKETGKLGYYVAPAVKIKELEGQAWDAKIQKYFPITEQHCFCPQCGARVETKPKTAKALPVPILFNKLEKKPRQVCRKCQGERKYRKHAHREPGQPYYEMLKDPKATRPRQLRPCGQRTDQKLARLRSRTFSNVNAPALICSLPTSATS